MHNLPRAPRGMYFRFACIFVLPMALVIGLLAGILADPGVATVGIIGIVYANVLLAVWPRYVYRRFPEATINATIQILRARGYTVLEPQEPGG